MSELGEFINIYTIGNIRRVYNPDTGKMEDGQEYRDKCRRDGWIVAHYEGADQYVANRYAKTDKAMMETHRRHRRKHYNADVQILARRIEEDVHKLDKATGKDRTLINREFKLLTYELLCLRVWAATYGYEEDEEVKAKADNLVKMLIERSKNNG